MAWHNGGTKAFLSQLALLPEKKLGVVVLANADNAGDLVYATAEEALRLALEIRHGVAPPKKMQEPEIELTRAVLAERVGDYSLMGSLARISLGKKRLRLHVLKHVLDLVPVTPDRFRVEFNLLGLKSVPIPFPPVEFAQVGERDVRAAARPGRDTCRENSTLPHSRDLATLRRRIPHHQSGCRVSCGTRSLPHAD